MENKETKKEKPAKDGKKVKLSWKQILISAAIATVVSAGAAAGITMGLNSTKWVLPSYTVTFVNDDDSVLGRQTVKLGESASYNGSTPVKQIKEDWMNYKFIGWDKSTKNIISDTTFKAEYESTNQTYTMTWYDSDGTTVLKEETINKGIDPEYGSIPTKPSTATTQYVFSGWTYTGDWRTSDKMSAKANYDSAQVGLTIKNGVVEHYVGSGEVTIPSVWEGVPVTTVGPYAFASSTENGTSVTKVTLPNSITTLEPYAFAGATELTDVVFPQNENITIINENLFNGCKSLKSIDLPDSVTLIKDYAFANCSELQTFKLGSKLVDFASTAFNYCFKLASVEIDPNNERFTTDTNCPGMIFSKDKTVLIRCLPSVDSVDSTKLPSTLTVIIAKAFQACKNITTIDFSNCNVTTIDALAFQASGIKTFVSGDKIEAFGSNVFSSCNELESITLGSKVDPEKMEWDSLLGCNKLTTINIDTNNTKMAASNNIVYAKENGSLVSVLRCLPNNDNPVIESGVKVVGEYAFDGCQKITKINFLVGVEQLKENAFNGCTSVTEATLPDSITKVGANVFYGCNALTKISVGTGLKFDWSGDLDFKALDGCINLKEIEVDPNNTSLSSNNGVLYAKYVDTATSTTTNWIIKYPPLKDGEEFTIPNTVNAIGQYVFSGAKNLKKVIIPSSIFGIFDYAFQNCTNLENVEFNGNLSEMDDQFLYKTAFSGCEKLNTITIDKIDDATTFGESLEKFAKLINSETTNVVLNIGSIPEGLSAKLYNNFIKNLEIAGTVTSIPTETFKNCYTMEALKMNDAITTIEKEAFKACTNLKTISFSSSLQTIGESGFAGSQKIEDVVWPNSLKTISGHAFESCVKINFNSFPDSLTTIGEYCFTNNNAITSLNTNNISTIGAGAFANLHGLTELTIGHSITKIGGGAFKGCENLSQNSDYTINYDGTEAEWNAIQFVSDPFSDTPVAFVRLLREPDQKIIKIK